MVYVVYHIFDAVKNSLARLQVDYIDLLQCMTANWTVLHLVLTS